MVAVELLLSLFHHSKAVPSASSIEILVANAVCSDFRFQLKLVYGCGHNVQEDQPRETAASILNFAARYRRATTLHTFIPPPLLFVVGSVQSY